MAEKRGKSMSASATLNRRQFLRRTSGAALGAVAFPYIIPGSALGADGAVAPSERVTIGCIGLGGMGSSNMQSFLGFKEAHVVAVCDVDKNHRDAAKGAVDERYKNQDCATYNDFRELLARTDLDAVSIAVPDHWHAIPAIAAAKRGLDIYAEKPLALTIKEGRAMCDAVHKHGVVWQTGSWQRSQEHFRRACELVRNGRIGEVHTVEVGLPTGHGCDPQPAMPVPEGFDYDFWLGPAPLAPYTEKRCHWNFRWILDYSGGQLTDWAAHHCDIANWGMGTEYTGPISAEGKGEYPREGLWDAAINYDFTCQYAPGASPVAPKGFIMRISNGLRGGAKFIGTKGWVSVDRGFLETDPVTLKDSFIEPDELRLYKSVNHHRNFLDCVKTRQLTITPIEVAQRAISLAHIGNICMRLGRKVKWDPAEESFGNDDEANRMRLRAMRAPWHI